MSVSSFLLPLSLPRTCLNLSVRKEQFRKASVSGANDDLEGFERADILWASASHKDFSVLKGFDSTCVGLLSDSLGLKVGGTSSKVICSSFTHFMSI